MKNFKVGDKVRIRSWESMRKGFGTEFGNIKTAPSFLKNMEPLCGRIATIKSINGKKVKLDSWDTSYDTAWNYCTDMLEPAEKNEED